MSDYTAGFRYLFGIHMGICRSGSDGVDEVCEVRVGDRTAWVGSATANQQIAIDAYNLFGGEESEGGVQGTLHILMGGDSQLAPDELAGMSSGGTGTNPAPNARFPGGTFIATWAASVGVLPRVCGLIFNTDGTTTIDYHGVQAVSVPNRWYSAAPASPTLTAPYEVKIDVLETFGAASIVGTTGVWLSLSAARSIAIQSAAMPQGNPHFARLNITFRRGSLENPPVETWLFNEQENEYNPGGA